MLIVFIHLIHDSGHSKHLVNYLVSKGHILETDTPNFSRTLRPFSWYSSRLIQKAGLSFMMFASTAPPRNTMCLRLGGSSIRILNF